MSSKVIVINKERKKTLKPHTLGKRNIKDLAKEMELYVEHLKRKGVRVVKVREGS